MRRYSISIRRLFAVVFFVLFACAAQARVKFVPPGQTPKLDADEGLVAIVIDTSSSLRDVRFRKDGKLFDSATIKNIQPGATPRLYIVPAGEYEWSRANTFFSMWYEFKDSPDTKFRVEPGMLNYPGDLLMRGVYTKTADFRFSNRSLQLMDWLEEFHPKIFSNYEFSYRGHYPDPFPKFYLEAKAANGKPFSELGFALEPPAAGTLPIPVRDLWRANAIEDADLSPSGRLMVKVLNRADGRHLELVDLGSGASQSMMTGCCPIETMQWAGDDVFVVGSRKKGSTTLYIDVFRMSRGADGNIGFDHFGISRAGLYLQVLPEDPNHILFASLGEMNRLVVNRVSIRSREALQNFNPHAGTRINTALKDDIFWLADGRGRLRLALVRQGEASVLMHGLGQTFEEVLRYDVRQPFQPHSLSYEGDLIYGLSDDGREQRDLVVFDPAQKKIVSTLFSKPGIDVVAPILDEKRQPIGAVYYQRGHLVSEYFGQQGQDITRSLSEQFPGRTVAGYDCAGNGDILAWVESSDDPGGLYHVDSAKKRATKIESAKPWLSRIRFPEAELLSVPAADGFAIEAYLTKPRNAAKSPLVVLSHGGPVGVRDERGFNSEVQFLASLGYAVLQVNFRGSDGYGTRFRDSGRRAHGTAIEDDIDTVLTRVLQDPHIDAGRVCAIGSSYGGYSALVSTVRWPQRFRCAVSLSGVTDMLLFFTSSDSGNSARGRTALEHYVGDPRTEADAMMRNSPIYRYRELKAPLMFVHGAEDARVDFEHMRRMVRMLNIAGVRPVALTLEKEGHTYDSWESLEATWGGIAGFLRRHLGDPLKPAAAAPTATPAPAVQSAAPVTVPTPPSGEPAK